MTSITLPCGCKINETTVLAMCIGHHQQIHCQRIEREGAYASWVQRMTDLASSPQRRGGEHG